MVPTVLSLFSGYAGLDLGLEAAIGAARVVGYVEREGYSAAVLMARMEESSLGPAPVYGDDVAGADLSAFRGVDWVTAGFPCQPWSVAGTKRGLDDERWLWPDIERIVREVRPGWVLLENVVGLVRGGLGPVLRSLSVLGFDAEWCTIRAGDLGANHERLRVFLLARSRELADADGGGRVREGRDREFGSSEGQPRLGRSLFPPRRRLDLWTELLRRAPTLEPSICRVAHGSPSWMDDRSDRIRALGNGVVPLQAAVAIRVLAARGGWRLTG